MSKTKEQVESKVESILSKPYVLFLENDVVRMETQRGEFHIAYRRNT
jgi:hypothetical protein